MADLRALMMALPHPVVVLGPSEGAAWRIRALNDPAKRLIGADMTGRHYVTALRQPVLLDAVDAVLTDGGTRTTRYLANDGARETVWDVHVSTAELSGDLCAVLYFQDMTALEDVSQMRRDFVANVSHEMRTPLTSMMGFIETLRGPARNDAAAQDRFLVLMEQEAGRMHGLVEALLSLSRVENQERIRPTTKVPLKTLIGAVLEALAPRAQATGVTFVQDVPADPIEVLGDWDQLWQVVVNLVENSIKYGAKNGRVTVRLTPPQPEPALMQSAVRLSVSDEGEGIAPHHIARLTERFYRIDSHRSREVGGTGLGLAIVKHIINRHRGRLRINSIVGQGSEFTVILPV